jgi:hypothetical protein
MNSISEAHKKESQVEVKKIKSLPFKPFFETYVSKDAKLL